MCRISGLPPAFNPEVRHDHVDYHINFANLYAVEGRLVEIPWHLFSYMPQNVELLYTLAMVVADTQEPLFGKRGRSIVGPAATVVHRVSNGRSAR